MQKLKRLVIAYKGGIWSQTIQHVLTQLTSIYSAHHVLPGIALNHFDSEEKKKGEKGRLSGSVG